ncbi:hypothetical protein PO124_21300 [Bacillus licheniformis]|nr:hypothetical protein [Bacillus licheniformis]
MHSDPNIIRGKSKHWPKRPRPFVSLNGETEELVEAAQNFKLQAISTITLTTRIDSRLAKLSEIVLVGFKGEQSFFPIMKSALASLCKSSPASCWTHMSSAPLIAETFTQPVNIPPFICDIMSVKPQIKGDTA